MIYDGPLMKSVIALSRHYDDNMAVQLNAIGHIGLALGRGIPNQRMANYRTADGEALGELSWWPVIILSGRPSKISDFWTRLRGRTWPKACFVEAMISGGSEIQLEAAARLRMDNLPIVAVGVHGPAADLHELTRKLGLWKGGNAN